MEEYLTKIEQQVHEAMTELLQSAQLPKGSLFVLGCSSSEVVGGVIGKKSNLEVAQVIVKTILNQCKLFDVELCVQGCEHINRSLVIEREVAERLKYEVVSVIPALHAGGACSVVAYESMRDPVVVEHVVARAGLDIGDTSIGMHVKHVQIPKRLKVKEIGSAHVTALTSRPKLIGGPRAVYEK